MKLTFLTFIFSSLIFLQSMAQVDPIDRNGLAIGGYDLVSYFKLLRPVKGNPDIATELGGVKYYFSTQENKKSFEANPSEYLPQYEGYCALAVGTTGKKISIDPEAFKITNGKLYLFFHGKSFSGTVFNSIDPWIKDEANLIRKSDEMWPKVRQRKYKYENWNRLLAM